MIILTWQARDKKGLTLIQLSKLTGISVGALSNIENGKVLPRIDQLEAIAKATDTYIEDLFESEYKRKIIPQIITTWKLF